MSASSSSKAVKHQKSAATSKALPSVGSFVRVHKWVTLAKEKVLERLEELRHDDNMYVGDDIVKWTDDDGVGWTVRKAPRGEKGGVDFVVKAKEFRKTSVEGVRAVLEVTPKSPFAVTSVTVADAAFVATGTLDDGSPGAFSFYEHDLVQGRPTKKSVGWSRCDSRGTWVQSLEEEDERVDEGGDGGEGDEEGDEEGEEEDDEEDEEEDGEGTTPASKRASAQSSSSKRPIMFSAYDKDVAHGYNPKVNDNVIYPVSVGTYAYAGITQLNSDRTVATLRISGEDDKGTVPPKVMTSLLTPVLFRVGLKDDRVVVRDCSTWKLHKPDALEAEVAKRVLSLWKEGSLCVHVLLKTPKLLEELETALSSVVTDSRRKRGAGASVSGGSKRRRELVTLAPYATGMRFESDTPVIGDRVVLPLPDGGYDRSSIESIFRPPKSEVYLANLLGKDEGDPPIELPVHLLVPVLVVIFVDVTEALAAWDGTHILDSLSVHLYGKGGEAESVSSLNDADLACVATHLADEDKPLLVEVVLKYVGPSMTRDNKRNVCSRARRELLSHAQTRPRSAGNEDDDEKEDGRANEAEDENARLLELLARRLAESKRRKAADAARKEEETRITEALSVARREEEVLKSSLAEKQATIAELEAKAAELKRVEEEAGVGEETLLSKLRALVGES